MTSKYLTLQKKLIATNTLNPSKYDTEMNKFRKIQP